MPSPGCSSIVDPMTTTPDTRPIDAERAERLSTRFGAVFETFDPDHDLFAPDAFFDLNMPVWRFQLVGGDTFAGQLRAIARGKVQLDVLRTVPTASGFVAEHEERQVIDAGTEDEGEMYSARRLWLCEVRDGRIAEVVGYCSGEWDEALRARHAAEAPMLRP
jgi:ketosteroid isomerase-like protein